MIFGPIGGGTRVSGRQDTVHENANLHRFERSPGYVLRVRQPDENCEYHAGGESS
jgi:hypothetical protein